MDQDTLFVFAVIAVAAVLFASGRVRLDIVAMGVVIVLAVSGILTTEEALSGFGDPVVILVAALLVVGEGLTRTGVSHRIGAFIGRVGGSSETRFLVVLMLVAAVFGSVMSSTAVVAIFIPVVVNLARRNGMAVSRLLIPLSFAALISGMLTLIGTTPNLVVAEALENAGFEPFAFFTFTPIGIAVLAIAVVFMVLIGRRLLPSGEGAEDTGGRGSADLLADYGFTGISRLFHVADESSLVGRTLDESGLGELHEATVLVLEQGEAHRVLEVSPYAFAMTVAIAASAAFSTPVSTPVTTLVMEPGRYAFMDFVKVGVPLVLLTLVVCVVLIPILFPFT